MDNLTHSLLGMALARTRLGRLSPYATPALVIGANLPDADILVRLWGGPDGYLVHHRGVTHGLLGAALLACGLALSLRAFERWRGRGQEGSWRGALSLAAIALASHPLLDLLNVYGLRPWLPFDASWCYGDAVFILDPWLWLTLGLGALLGGPRRRAGDVTWALLYALAGVVVGLSVAAGLAPLPLGVAWGVLAVGLVVARLRGPAQGRPGWPVACGLGLALLYVTGLFALGPVAAARARSALADARADATPWSAVTHAPQPLDPLNWEVLLEDRDAVWVQPIHLWKGAGEPTRLDKLGSDERVESALRSDCSAAWRSFVRHPHVALEERADGTWVELMDARYQREPSLAGNGGVRRGGWSSSLVRVRAGQASCSELP